MSAKKTSQRQVISIFIIVLILWGILIPVLSVLDSVLNPLSLNPELEYDYHVVIVATINPSIFNVTLLDGIHEERPDCDFSTVISSVSQFAQNYNYELKSQKLDLACNDIQDSQYLIQTNSNSGLDYWKLNEITLLVKPNRSETEFLILALTLLATDTEHSLIFAEAENPDGILSDIHGSTEQIFMDQLQPITTYLKIPNRPAEYLFRCAFFCSAGHFGQTGKIFVENGSTS